jgi:agmatine/peptidylarginine deiminase
MTFRNPRTCRRKRQKALGGSVSHTGKPWSGMPPMSVPMLLTDGVVLVYPPDVWADIGVWLGTNPNVKDTDGDGLWDGDEMYPNIIDIDGTPNEVIVMGVKRTFQTNPKSIDTDGDIIVSSAAPMTDKNEITAYTTNPTSVDTDGDGLKDAYELYCGRWKSAAEPGCLPNNPDTDGDDLYDGWVDSNGNGQWDTNELLGEYGVPGTTFLGGYGTDPNNEDTDNDKWEDGVEIAYWLSLTNPSYSLYAIRQMAAAGGWGNPYVPSNDVDGDGWLDGDEIYRYKTRPDKDDTDSDSVHDDLDIDPLVDLSVHINIINFVALTNTDDPLWGQPDIVIKYTVNGLSASSTTWWDTMEINNWWSPFINVPDNMESVAISIEVIDNDSQDVLDWVSDSFDIFPEPGVEILAFSYSTKVGDWSGNVPIKDALGHGISDGQYDFSGTGDGKIKFDVSQNDYDSDGLTYWQEVYARGNHAPSWLPYGTDPTNSDSDNDLINDGDEINKYYSNPLNSDSDGDGINDKDDWFTPPEWTQKNELIITWPSSGVEQQMYINIINNATEAVEKITINVEDETSVRQTIENEVKAQYLPKIHYSTIDLNGNIWIRDYGPQFITNPYGEIAVVDWLYGSVKEDGYPSFYAAEEENNIPYPPVQGQMIHHGGDFQVDGNGYGYSCRITTADEINLLTKTNGLKGIRNLPKLQTDPNEHIDMFAYITSSNTVILSNIIQSPNNDDYYVYETWRSNFQSWGFTTYSIDSIICRWDVPLPQPPYHAPFDLIYTYTNALILNDRVLVPQYFNDTPDSYADISDLLLTDSMALQVYHEIFPNKQIIPIYVPYYIINGFGSIHCLTMTRPSIPWS